MESGFCLAGTPIAHRKRWGGSVMPIEKIRAKAILPIEQSFDDQKAEEMNKQEELANELRRTLEELANKYE